MVIYIFIYIMYLYINISRIFSHPRDDIKAHETHAIYRMCGPKVIKKA